MLDLRCAVCQRDSTIDAKVSELVDVTCPHCGTHLRLVVVPLGLMPGYDARQYPGLVPSLAPIITDQEIVGVE